jgi:hypothetical protein
MKNELGMKMNAYRLLVGKLRRRWVGNIKIYSAEIVWIVLVQGRDKWRALVNEVMKFRIS